MRIYTRFWAKLFIIIYILFTIIPGVLFTPVWGNVVLLFIYYFKQYLVYYVHLHQIWAKLPPALPE